MLIPSRGEVTASHGALETARPTARAVFSLTRPSYLIFAGLVVIVGFLGLYPSIFLLYGSFTDAPLGVPGHFTLANYIQAYADPQTYKLVLTSFGFAFAASSLSLILSFTLAWITIRTNAPLRKVFELTAIIPNILPTLLVAISWVLLLNPSNGLINVVLIDGLGLRHAPFNIYSMAGLVFVEGLILSPLAFLIIAAALKSMDPAMEESARTLGSSELGIAWRITFPLMRPAILGAGTLNFVRAIESFDAPAIIAIPARIEVFTTKIYREALGSFPTNQNLAAAYGVGILVIALIFVCIYRSFTSHAESFATVTGKGFHPREIDLGPWKYLASTVAFLLLILMVLLPLMVLLLVSLMPYFHVPDWQTWHTLTLEHFRAIVESSRTYRAFANSLFLSVVGATLCIFLAALVSYFTVKTKIAGRGLLEGLVFVPWAFPGVALALGLLWAYVDFPIPVLCDPMDFIDWVRYPLFAVRCEGGEQLGDPNSKRARRGLDGIGRGFFVDVWAHHCATDAARDARGVDHPSNHLHPRVQHVDFSLQPGFGASGTAAVFLLFGRGLWPAWQRWVW